MSDKISHRQKSGNAKRKMPKRFNPSRQENNERNNFGYADKKDRRNSNQRNRWGLEND